MNRKNLTAAVLAGLAGAAGIVGSAQAVNINPDGLGQVLIYPYFTVNGGNTTVLSVVNTTDYAKAVKVRFKEGKNSREVLDFNLYLSPYDVWTASIRNVDGTPTMKTADNSCTVPYIYGNGGEQEFLPWAMNDTGVADEYGPISRATEGYFEMIEMGVVTDDTEGSATSATHVDGMMDTCDNLVAAWSDPDDLDPDDNGYWYDDFLVDIDAPMGGLFGGAAVVNVQAGTMYTYDAKAINGFAESENPNFVPLHQPPGTSAPSLASGGVTDAKVFSDQGQLLESVGLTRSIDAVSFVFMHDQVMNEYITGSGIGAHTEWVMTFPTKSHYVYGEEAGALPGEILDDEDVLAPFTTAWDGMGACEAVGLENLRDREEQTYPEPDDPVGQPDGPIVSPAPPFVPGPDPDPIIPFELCYEVSVIEFGPPAEPCEGEDCVEATSGILGSSNFHNIDNTQLGFESGWAQLQLDDYVTDENEDGVAEPQSRDPLGGLEGLPVTGFAVQAFVNSVLGDGADTLANYGGIFQHKATRKMGSALRPQ